MLSSICFKIPNKSAVSSPATYTVVASKSFFGDRIVEWNDLKGRFFTASYDTHSATSLVLGFAFEIGENGLHHTTVTISNSCTMKIKNFLSKGYTLETFKRDQVAMFEGEMSLFDGFRKYSDLSGYKRAENELTIYTDYDNKIDFETIKNSVIAYDNNDGILEDITVVSDNYSNSTGVGDYKIVLQTKDSNDNLSNITLNVKVVDKTRPVITGPGIIEWELGNPCPTEAEIIKYFKATDNVDGDISSKIKISSSGLGAYVNHKESRYIINLEVKDNAGNSNSKSVFLDVIDTTPPIVEVIDVTYNLSESFSTLEDLSHKVYKNAYDKSGQTHVSFSCQEYMELLGFAGKYEVAVTVKDAYGNSTVKKAFLTIVDDIAPEFYLKVDLINTSADKMYGVSDVKNVIRRNLKESGILYDEIQLISCNYFNTEKSWLFLKKAFFLND